MDLQLKDKVVIVTGGAKGIGEGICRALAAEGAIPVIIGRNEQDNLLLADSIKATGGKAFQVVAELSRPEECKKAVDAVLAEFGRIEGVVNNAGTNDGVGLEDGDYDFIKGLGIEAQYGVGKIAKAPLSAGSGATVGTLVDWGMVTGFVSGVANA